MGNLDFLKKKAKSYVLSWDGVTDDKEVYIQETGLTGLAGESSKYATWYKINSNSVDTSFRLEFLYDVKFADELSRLNDIKYLGFKFEIGTYIAAIAYASSDNCKTESKDFYINAAVFPTAGWWILAGYNSTENPTTTINIPAGTKFIKVTNEPSYNISKKNNKDYKSPFYEIRNPDYVDGDYYRYLFDSESAFPFSDKMESSDGTLMYLGTESSCLLDNFNPVKDGLLNYITPTADDLIKVKTLLDFGKIIAYDTTDYPELLQEPYQLCNYFINNAVVSQNKISIVHGLGKIIGPFIMMCLVDGSSEYTILAVVRDTTKNILEIDGIDFSLSESAGSSNMDAFEISDSDFNKLISLGKNDELYVEFKNNKNVVIRNAKLYPKESTIMQPFNYSSALNKGFAVVTQTFVSGASNPSIRSNVDTIFFKRSSAKNRYELFWDGITDGKISASYGSSSTYPTFYKISDEEYFSRLKNYSYGCGKSGSKFTGIYIAESSSTAPKSQSHFYNDGGVFISPVGNRDLLAYVPQSNYKTDFGGYFGPSASYSFKEKGWYYAASDDFVGKLADIEVY